MESSDANTTLPKSLSHSQFVGHTSSIAHDLQSSTPMFVQVPINGQVYLVEAKQPMPMSIHSVKEEKEDSTSTSHSQIIISSAAPTTSATNANVHQSHANGSLNGHQQLILTNSNSRSGNNNINNKTGTNNSLNQYQVVVANGDSVPMRIPIPIITVPVASHGNENDSNVVAIASQSTSAVTASLSSPFMSTLNRFNSPCSSNANANANANANVSVNLSTLNSDHDYLTVAATTTTEPPLSVPVVSSISMTTVNPNPTPNSHTYTVSSCTSSTFGSLSATDVDGVEELFAISNPLEVGVGLGISNAHSDSKIPSSIQNQNQPMLLLWDVDKNVFEKNGVSVNNIGQLGKVSNNSDSAATVSIHESTNGATNGNSEGYDLTGTNTTLTAETIYRCKRCLRTFPLYTIANYHYKTVHLGLNEYRCQWCNKLFPGCLKVHMDLCLSKRANSTPILKKKSNKSTPKTNPLRSLKRQIVTKSARINS